jgi:hypothetical protein
LRGCAAGGEEVRRCTDSQLATVLRLRYRLPKLVMFVDGRGNAECCLNLARPIASIRTTPGAPPSSVLISHMSPVSLSVTLPSARGVETVGRDHNGGSLLGIGKVGERKRHKHNVAAAIARRKRHRRHCPRTQTRTRPI